MLGVRRPRGGLRLVARFFSSRPAPYSVVRGETRFPTWLQAPSNASSLYAASASSPLRTGRILLPQGRPHRLPRLRSPERWRGRQLRGPDRAKGRSRHPGSVCLSRLRRQFPRTWRRPRVSTMNLSGANRSPTPRLCATRKGSDARVSGNRLAGKMKDLGVVQHASATILELGAALDAQLLKEQRPSERMRMLRETTNRIIRTANDATRGLQQGDSSHHGRARASEHRSRAGAGDAPSTRCRSPGGDVGTRGRPAADPPLEEDESVETTDAPSG